MEQTIQAFRDSTGLVMKLGDRVVSIRTGGQYTVEQIDTDGVWFNLCGQTWKMYGNFNLYVIIARNKVASDVNKAE